MFLKVPEGFQRKNFSSCPETLLLPYNVHNDQSQKSYLWTGTPNFINFKKMQPNFENRQFSLSSHTHNDIRPQHNASIRETDAMKRF